MVFIVLCSKITHHLLLLLVSAAAAVYIQHIMLHISIRYCCMLAIIVDQTKIRHLMLWHSVAKFQIVMLFLENQHDVDAMMKLFIENLLLFFLVD
jgi:hypothetical protein